jgi:hypothetical protein
VLYSHRYQESDTGNLVLTFCLAPVGLSERFHFLLAGASLQVMSTFQYLCKAPQQCSMPFRIHKTYSYMFCLLRHGNKVPWGLPCTCGRWRRTGVSCRT